MTQSHRISILPFRCKFRAKRVKREAKSSDVSFKRWNVEAWREKFDSRRRNVASFRCIV